MAISSILALLTRCAPVFVQNHFSLLKWPGNYDTETVYIIFSSAFPV